MEDDNGLELSLGLNIGGSSSIKCIGKSGSPSETRMEENDRGKKEADDLRNFFDANQKDDSSTALQKGSSSLKSQDNFFNCLSRVPVDAEESGKTPEPSGLKRKNISDETNYRKKHEQNADSLKKSKMSRISVTSESGSIAENEDVAESEVGSESRIIALDDDGSKRSPGLSELGPKGVQGSPNSSHGDLHAQKMFRRCSENEFRLGNIPYGNTTNVHFSIAAKDSNSASAVTSLRTLNGDHQAGTQLVNSGNFPVMFGYSSVQLPLLDKDSAFAGRDVSNPDKHNDVLKTSQAAMQEGVSYLTEEERKRRNLGATEGSIYIAAEGSSSSDITTIKPGIAADVRFGGCGSYPNLPWVSTTGPGPEGRTISGVTYRYNANEVKIVCACHGSHMSLEEFVRHAAEDSVNSDRVTGLPTFSNTNPSASAQS